MSTDHNDLHDGPGDDDHAHGEAPLGPIDVAAWGAGAFGIVLGALVAVCFALAAARPG